MLFTLYYYLASFMQSERISRIFSKVAEKLSEKTSVVFYIQPEDSSDTLATSELCTNGSQARISDFLWLRGNQRGCCLKPIQNVHLGRWVSFPASSSSIPFEWSLSKYDLKLNESNLMHLLLETDIVPKKEFVANEEVIEIEKFGTPIAWKVDSQFAVILQSDLEHFTKLIMTTFMQENFEINDHLPLIRIESVTCEGKPQPFEQMKTHVRRHLMSQLSVDDWDMHLAGLRNLSSLANQAVDFEGSKQRTSTPDFVTIPTKDVEEEVVGELKTIISPGRRQSFEFGFCPRKRPSIHEDEPIFEKTIQEHSRKSPPIDTFDLVASTIEAKKAGAARLAAAAMELQQQLESHKNTTEAFRKRLNSDDTNSVKENCGVLKDYKASNGTSRSILAPLMMSNKQ